MYSLTEYKVGSKIMTGFAICFLVYGYSLYIKIESLATEVYAIKQQIR